MTREAARVADERQKALDRLVVLLLLALGQDELRGQPLIHREDDRRVVRRVHHGLEGLDVLTLEELRGQLTLITRFAPVGDDHLLGLPVHGSRLEQLNLITKSKIGKRLSYLPANPIQIEMLAEKRRNILLNNEYRFKSLLPSLTQRYHQLTEQPAVRQYQGVEGLKDIYDDILQTKADVMLIISPNQHDFLGSDYLDDFVATRVRKGIKVQALTPQGFTLQKTPAKHKAHLIEHTFYNPDTYNIPVEINIYADKVAYLSYGQEVFGTVIHSQQIADSMRQLFMILRLQMQASPDSFLSEKQV